MKLMLWQQFSSNHSGSFAIVGLFDTTEQAEQATAAARDILRRISEYWETLEGDEREAILQKVMNGGRTPVEDRLYRELGVKWDGGSDWIPYFTTEEVVEAASINQINVSVGCLLDTWNGGEVFQRLFEKLGGLVISYGYSDLDYGMLEVIDVMCRAPDGKMLNKLLSDVTVLDPTSGAVVIAGRFETIRRSITTDDLTITYTFEDFGHLFRGFPRFTDYLKEHGCTDIQLKPRYEEPDIDSEPAL
jgi:hypothetical protein